MIERSDEMNEALVNLALSFYAGEPCRVCGFEITMDDLNDGPDGAVYAGYNKSNTSRTAHGRCWRKYLDCLATLDE